MNTLDLEFIDKAKSLFKDTNLVILENGTIITSHSTTSAKLVIDAAETLNRFKPGNIDFRFKKIDDTIGIASYNVRNVYNIVDIQNYDNKSRTYLAIMGRNNLIKDLNVQQIAGIVINNILQKDYPSHRLNYSKEH